MTRLTVAALHRFGLLTTIKLALMVVVIVGCLGRAALTPPGPPAPVWRHCDLNGVCATPAP